ncbi:MAG: hypothetical protein JKY54_19685 [Flavobacteriales bacterium]|nr:hypothetical protein [Flavobacteriales bacterium]
MKKLLINISILSLLIGASLIAVFYGIRNPANPQVDFLNQRFTNVNRIKNDTSSHRIILVGGSNLGFGIDSKLMREVTGKTVQNLGLQRGLGVPYMLAEVNQVARSGDEVVFAFEYDFFYEKELSGITPLLILENDPSHVENFMAPDDMGRIVRFFPSFFRIKMNEKLFGGSTVQNPIYHADAFNDYGDVISHLKEPSKIKDPNYRVFKLDRTDKNVNRINDWILQHPEVTCTFTFPPLAMSKYLEYETEVLQLEKELKELLNCPIKGTAKKSAYSDSLFFDSVNHLNAIGRAKRSRDLSKLIVTND